MRARDGGNVNDGGKEDMMDARMARRDRPWLNPQEEDWTLDVTTVSVSAACAKRLQLGLLVELCIAEGAIYSHSIPPAYTATAALVLEPRQASASRLDQGAASQTPSLDVAQAESQIQVIRSERLLATVFNELGLATVPELAPPVPGLITRLRSSVDRLFGETGSRVPTLEELHQIAFANFQGRFYVRRVGLSYVIEVSYSSGDPSQARRVVNATMSAYLFQSVTFKADAARNGAEFLQSRVNALMAEAKSASSGIAAGTLPEGPTPDADARVISAALQPLARSAPRTGLIIAFAGSLGLMVGFFALALAHALDRRVRTAEMLMRDTGVRCLGVVPEAPRRLSGLRRRTEAEMGAMVLSDPGGTFASAIRDLRTTIMISIGQSRDGKAGKVIAIASWSPDAGCTLLCANLAQVVKSSGHSALLIDADVHRSDSGLTSQVGRVSVGLAEALVEGGSLETISSVSIGDVPLVPARSSDHGRTHNAYLGAPEMIEILDRCRSRGDVFLDLPPLRSTGDARAVATHADAVLLVAVAGKTTRDEIASAVATLETVGAQVLGVVINRAKV